MNSRIRQVTQEEITSSAESLSDILDRIGEKIKESPRYIEETFPSMAGRGTKAETPYPASGKNISSAAKPQPSLPQSHALINSKKLSSGLPVEMTRLNPFFIMTKQEMKKRPVEEVTVLNSFGRITMVGERLTVYEETVFLAVLYLVMQKKSTTITTSRYELLDLMGISKGGGNYVCLWDALKRLGRTQIVIEKWAKSKTGEGEPKLIRGFFNSLIQRGEFDSNSNSIKLTLDPYFLDMYAKNLLTFIDMGFRKNLKGDITKALYRFYQGQSRPTYSIGIDKLCKAINLGEKGERKKLRAKLRDCHSELKNCGYLQGWKLSGEVLTIVRAQ